MTPRGLVQGWEEEDEFFHSVCGVTDTDSIMLRYKSRISYLFHQLMMQENVYRSLYESEYLDRESKWGIGLGDEHGVQREFVDWFHETFPEILIYMIPNEYVTMGLQMQCFRKEGGVGGMPDLHVPEFNLWIEMKRYSGNVSLVQRGIHEILINIGHTVVVGYGLEDAIEKVGEVINARHIGRTSLTPVRLLA